MDLQPYIDKLKENTFLSHTGSPYHSPQGDALAMEYEYGEMLMEAVANNAPKEIVEIGTGTGYSTSWMSLGCLKSGKGKITTFDYEDRKANLRGVPFNKVKFHVKHFDHVQDELPKKIDFVLHDAQHRYELITADLDKVMPLMNPTCQVWIHDVRGSELPHMMKEYFEKLGFSFTHFPTGNGMGKATRGEIV